MYVANRKALSKGYKVERCTKRTIHDWKFWITSTILINYITEGAHKISDPWLEHIYSPLILTSLRPIECPVDLNMSVIAAIIAYCLAEGLLSNS